MPGPLGRMSRAHCVMATALFLVGFLVTSRERTIEGAAQNHCVVTLPGGDVQGLALPESCAFLGVPYAASTAGDNRWKYIILDSVIREGMRPREARCGFFEAFFFRSLLGAVPASAQ